VKNLLFAILIASILSACDSNSNDSTINSNSGTKDTLATTAKLDSVPWKQSIPYGSLVDSRDGHTYKTVTIGSQTWMAENINYKAAIGSNDSIGVCYNYSNDNCAKYGRMYTWAEVMAIDTGYNKTIWNGNSNLHRGVCPSDWHVPSADEWKKLSDTILPVAKSGSILKALNSWKNNMNGIDSVGFRALPSGDRINTRGFYDLGGMGYWWNSTENGPDAYQVSICYTCSYVAKTEGPKTYGLSLRCLRD